MDHLRRLEIFVQIAELGSFSAAADSLLLPPSTITAAMQQLETHLGTRLIHRTTRRMHLTADGESYLEWCRRLLDEINETESAIRGNGGRPKGRLRIDAPSRIANLVIAPALPDFFQSYPDIELELLATDRPIDLVREGVDGVIRVGTLVDSSLIARPLGKLSVGNFASPSYLAEHGTPAKPSDLGDHFAVGYISPGSSRVDDWEYVDNGRVKRLKMRSKIGTDNVGTYIACGVSGLGLIQIPAYDARQHLANSELVEVMPDRRAADMPASLLYSSRHHLSRRLRVFSDWIVELFDKNVHRNL